MRLIGVGLRIGQATGVVRISGSDSGGSAAWVVVVPTGARPPVHEGDAAWIAEEPSGIPLTEWGPGPVVGGIESDLFRPGDRVTVDGSGGWVELPDIIESPVVTAFLERPDGRVLLLQRSERVGSFRGAWAGVSGFLEDPTPEAQALREIREETGLSLDGSDLASSGERVMARGDRRIFIVHPFRFRVADPVVRLDWEHVGYEWVDPSEIPRRSTVPKLDRVWRAVAPTRPVT